METPEQQIDYQNLLNKYRPQYSEGVLSVLVFEGNTLVASHGSLLPTSLEGFPPPAATPNKINARRVNEQPCLIYSDFLPNRKQVCLIFPIHIRLSCLRSQAAKAMEELKTLSAPKTGGLSNYEEAVLAEFIQAAARSKYAQETENHTKPVRVNGPQTTPNPAQSATQALYWPYWYQIF
jgi:hypothetical protein